MRLQFRPKEIYIYNPELLKAERCQVIVIPSLENGNFSHQLNIRIEDPDAEDDAYCSFWINKNEAEYLAKFLLAFANEKQIDPDAED